MERVSAYAEGVRHERAMSESAAHGESTWTRKRTTAEGLMDGPFLDFLLEGNPSVRRLQLARAHRSAAPRLQRAQRPHFVRTHHHPLYTSTLVLCVLSDCPSLSVSACWERWPSRAAPRENYLTLARHFRYKRNC